jgi:predicted ATPase
MMRTKRRETHKRIAEGLLDLQPDASEAEPAVIARHTTEAGLLEEAIGWWTRAGQAAGARSANPEAVELIGRGLALIAGLPESEARDRRELALQTALFGPLISVRGQYSPEMEAAFDRTLELCERVDAPEAMFRALFVKSLSHGMRGQHPQFRAVAEDLLQRAERASDGAALLMGHRQLACALLLLGQVVEAQKHIDIVISTFDRERHGHVMVTYGQDPYVISEAYNGFCQWMLGWPDKASAARQRAIAKALQLDHVNTIGPVLSWGGVNAQSVSRDVEGLRQTCVHFHALISQHKMPIWEAIGRLSNAVLESMVNPSHQTATELHNVLLDFASLTRNAMMFPMWWGGSLAENYLAIGEPDKALNASEKGFEFAEASSEHWSDSDLLRIRGVALAMRDGAEGNVEAEAYLRRAIGEARSPGAKSFELRAAMSLARFLRDQGRSTEARETLAPIYGWFTEGFGTPDLIDARALLDELS